MSCRSVIYLPVSIVIESDLNGHMGQKADATADMGRNGFGAYNEPGIVNLSIACTCQQQLAPTSVVSGPLSLSYNKVKEKEG